MRRHSLAMACALATSLAGLSMVRADRSFDVVMTKVAMDAYGLQVVDRAQTPQQFEFGMTANLGWAHKPLRLQLNDINMGRQEAPFTLIEQQVTLDLGAADHSGDDRLDDEHRYLRRSAAPKCLAQHRGDPRPALRPQGPLLRRQVL